MKFQDLLSYKKGFDVAMAVFELSKSFPKEETYSLTDQIRRSSRSVTITIAEAYRKREYPKYFHSKLTDADAENSETQGWLEYALACKYITIESFTSLTESYKEVGRLINYMILNPEKFGVKKE
ncbi:four helix bundle protein [Flavobacterium succinicans]|jgi:four helix bundle protein|uniref:Four helix bundle protein n=1 Tax=Flavobacterium succinicans TaxID=29536 RepID=A0A1I4ZKT9_9FLAO|nr:four helix bundle protein [Flavobacterium succinicans]SFN50891.1 four helix bundle protein [Flavobacterium succinicans]